MPGVFELFYDSAPRGLPVEDLKHVHGVEPVPQPRVEVPRPLEEAKVDRPVALLPEYSVANSWQEFSARSALTFDRWKQIWPMYIGHQKKVEKVF
jgi:hypothetical protein